MNEQTNSYDEVFIAVIPNLNLQILFHPSHFCFWVVNWWDPHPRSSSLNLFDGTEIWIQWNG